MNCPKCQAEIPDGSKFCLECGSNISKASAQSAAEVASLGAQPTMAGAAAAEVSLGEQRTMAGRGAEKTAFEMAGTPLTERYEVLPSLAVVGLSSCRRPGTES